jgi:uncharacterized protein DUF6624
MGPDVDLACELAARCGVEQALRHLLDEVDDGDGRDAVVTRMHEVDEDNLGWFREVVAQRGWPGRSAVGTHGAEHAFLIAQHAVGDGAFQEHCLDLLRAAVQRGEAPPRHAAYLEDRVRMRRGQPQRYGTQLTAVGGGPLVPHELEDPGSVDERRRAVGLGPLADYLAGFGVPEPGAGS